MLGDRLRVARKTRGLSAAQLAQRVAISVSLLQKLESGARKATPSLILALARALHFGPGGVDRPAVLRGAGGRGRGAHRHSGAAADPAVLRHSRRVGVPPESAAGSGFRGGPDRSPEA
ncbi:helix-turn-helix domain-containing protein [Streptomyces celluloflavus]|uniref:helix-turn-helix domain-containing protein n=1 Tax=Streptomyces celluloflavus TaxID=58344 RepID=UPI0036DF01D9